MSLIKCPECNASISERAIACPQCGFTLNNINVEGTVKIETSEELKKWISLAKRAKEENNALEGAKYYQLISKEDPTNIEAAFYSVYFDAIQTYEKNSREVILDLNKRMSSTLSTIKEQNVDTDMPDFIDELGQKIINFCSTIYYRLQREMNPLINKANTFHFMEIVRLLQFLAYNTGDKIELLFGNKKYSDTICRVYKEGISIYIRMTTDCNSLPSSNTKELKNKAKYYVEKIKTYDKKYKSPIKWYM